MTVASDQALAERAAELKNRPSTATTLAQRLFEELAGGPIDWETWDLATMTDEVADFILKAPRDKSKSMALLREMAALEARHTSHADDILAPVFSSGRTGLAFVGYRIFRDGKEHRSVLC